MKRPAGLRTTLALSRRRSSCGGRQASDASRRPSRFVSTGPAVVRRPAPHSASCSARPIQASSTGRQRRPASVLMRWADGHRSTRLSGVTPDSEGQVRPRPAHGRVRADRSTRVGFEAGKDAAPVTRPDVGPHGRRDRIAPAKVPGLRRSGVRRHIIDPPLPYPGRHALPRQAASQLAARTIGSPMTVLAEFWSHSKRRRASRKAATVARSTTTGSRRAPSGRIWRMPKRLAPGTGYRVGSPGRPMN